MVDSQQTLDEFLALVGGVVVDVLELPTFDLLEEFLLALGAEGVVALQHHVEENAQRPHVGVDGRVVHLRNYLRSHVGRRPTESIDGGCLPAAQTEAEVYQFEMPVSVDEYVFCLDVPVDYVQLV